MIEWVAVAVGAVLAVALAVWGAAALWVRIISDRWNAMCADDIPAPRETRRPR